MDTGAEEIPVPATIDGLLRGLIRDGYPVVKGFKIADIDPRTEEFAADSLEEFCKLGSRIVTQHPLTLGENSMFGPMGASGDVWAVPEGTPIFPGEPFVTVRAPAIDAQLI